MKTYELTTVRWPDGSLNGRPYVTADGEYICEGYTGDGKPEALAKLIQQANAANELVAALRNLSGSPHLSFAAWSCITQLINRVDSALAKAKP